MSKKHKQRKTLQRQSERNVVALNPLLRKSAVHEKSTKARRKADKVQLKKTWFERIAVLAAIGQSHVLSNCHAK